MKWLGKTITRVLATTDATELNKIRGAVKEVGEKFALYRDL